MPALFDQILRCCLLALFAFVSITQAQAYNYGTDVRHLLRRQSASSRIVVGSLPLAANGSVPVRPEIRGMIANPYKWDLFVLALSMFQYASQDDPLSWYQIAGIHGVPFQTWNGVGPAPGADQSGYCPHSSIIFPMWHRPYLALFEQQMYQLVNEIAVMFPEPTERQLYEEAASDFRLPYWDWASRPPPGRTHFPEVFWDPVIAQKGPNGVQTIRNPLYAYPFHPLNSSAFIWSPMKYWPETKRAPALNVSETDPPSHNDQINTALLAKLPELQERLFVLFSNYKDFNTFSNKAWAATQNLTNLDSIESIHDVIHIYGGLKGHMTYVPLSAFDPLFLIHHISTDRLIAMWQALNPTSWMTEMPNGETSFNAPKGTIQNEHTPLTPFFYSSDYNGSFWNSDMARTTEIFGYTYADASSGTIGVPIGHTYLAKKIITLYGGSSTVSLGSRNTPEERAFIEPTDGWRLNARRDAFRPNVKAGADDPPASAIIEDGRYTEWIANVKVNVEALDGNYGVHFFVGEAPSDPRAWDTASNQIGAVSIFAMDRMTGSQSQISGTLPLTSALTKLVGAGQISRLDPEVVEPFLRATLKFRILGSNDKEVHPRLVDGLHVSVMSSKVTLRGSDAELPEWGPSIKRLQLWS